MAIADTIADKLLDRSIDLARLEAGERRKVLAMLREMETAIIAQLKDIDPTAPKLTAYRKARLEKLLTEVQAITRGAYTRINRVEQGVLEGVAVSEGPAVASAINTAIGVDLMSAGLGEARLKAVASDLLIQGAPAQEWWGRQAATTQLRFGDMMRQGLLQGQQLSEMIAQTQRLVRTRMTDAEALVRTSIQSVQNGTRLSVFEANSDIAQAIQWISAHDTRVCVVCRALSGKTWDVETKRPMGHTLRWPGEIAHMSCRCTTILIPKAFADLRQERGQRLQAQLDQLNAGQRAAIDGDLAADMTFEQWLKTKSPTVQRQILGQGRFELWSKGKVRLDKMVAQDHRPLTLEELRTA